MKTLRFPFLALALYSCGGGQTDSKAEEKLKTISHLQWLTGTWKSVSSEGTLYEVWKKESDSLMSGHGFLISGTDTLFSERLQLKQSGQDLLYIATVQGQNNEKPVPFKFSEFNKGEFNFVNLAHDFPQRIIYKNPQPDFLCTRIEILIYLS